MTSIGARLHSRFQQMVYVHGYGHDFLLNRRPGDRITFAGARLRSAQRPRDRLLYDRAWTGG